MKFKTYLIENTKESYRKEIDKETAIDLIKRHCKNAELDKPIIRGANITSNYQLLQGEISNRKPKTGKGYYNICIDHFIKKENSNYPLRSACIVGITYKGKNYAKVFGSESMAIIPFDTTKIALAPNSDLWSIEIPNAGMHYQKFSEKLTKYGVNATTYDELVNQISKLMQSNDEFKGDFFLLFKSSDKDQINESLDKAFNIVKNKNLNYSLINNNNELLTEVAHEVWMGGKCVAIELDEYNKILDEIKGDENTKVVKEKVKYKFYSKSNDIIEGKGIVYLNDELFDKLSDKSVKLDGIITNYRLLFSKMVKGQSKEVIDKIKEIMLKLKDKPTDDILSLIKEEPEYIEEALKVISKKNMMFNYKGLEVIFHID